MDNVLEGEVGWHKALLKADNDFILAFTSDCLQLLQKPKNFADPEANLLSSLVVLPFGNN